MMTEIRRATAILAGVLALCCAATAEAQAPPGEADQIHACLCEQQDIDALRGVMDAKNQALEAARHELSELDAQLAGERPKVDVADQSSVERYKALLERRDAAYQRASGAAVSDAIAAVNRYNARVADYNRNCAHQLFDATLMERVRAGLTCSAPR